jgi:sugar phosphate isomerase/epimerase
LAIEPMHLGCAAEWTFLTGLEDTLELIHAIDCPAIRLAFDVYHLGQDQEILSQLPELVPQLALVQLGDARQTPCGEQNRCRLGEGTLALQEIIATLNQAGYNGYYDIELMGEDLDYPDYRELILHSKQVFEQWNGKCV